MKHTLLHLLGCLLPLAVIFLLPLFGVSGGVLLLVFIILMFGCHLLMIRGHADMHEGHGHTQPKGDHHAHAQR